MVLEPNKEKNTLGSDEFGYRDEHLIVNFRTPKRKVSLKYLGLPKTPEEYRNEIIEWKLNVSVFRDDLIKVSRRLNDPDCLNQILRTGTSFSEVMERDEHYIVKAKAYPELKMIVDSISDGLDYAARNGHMGNPVIGIQSKKRADVFAYNMGDSLSEVREAGFTSMRAIAERFNELGIKSARGFDWSHTTVSQLIQRRKKLGLEGDSQEAGSLDAG